MEANCSNPTLPSDIIFSHILPWLQPNFLMRCCVFVCKSWFYHIRDPAFGTAYQNFRNKSTTNLLFQWNGYFFSSTIDKQGNPTPVTHLSHIPQCRPLHFADSINGLVCASVQHLGTSNSVFLFNPATGDSVKLPLGTTNSNCVRYQLGFCPLTNEYKVLLVDRGDKKLKLKIFTLGTNSWRPLEVDELPFDPTDWLDLARKTVCLHGAIHWVHENVLVVFDVGEETFRVIPLPEDYDHWAGDEDDEDECEYKTTSNVVKVEGCLGVYGENALQQKRMELWILKDYKNQVWVKETINLMSFKKETNDLKLKNTKLSVEIDPLCTIHTGDLALGLKKVPYALNIDFHIDGGPPQLHLYNSKSKQYTMHEFSFPETISTRFKREYRLRDLTKIDLLTCYDDSIVPLAKMR